MIEADILAAALMQWLPHQRWFAAKTTPISGVSFVWREDFGIFEIALVDVDLHNEPTQRYLIPLGILAPGEPMDPYLIPFEITGGVYDGLRDPKVIGALADHLAAETTRPHIAFATTENSIIESGWRGQLMSAEQSNSSVILNDAVLVKFFRRIFPGVNPDLEVHRALTSVGCTSIASSQGWISGPVDGVETTLAMAQTYAENSADGWSMALNSVRDLLDEGDLLAEEVGSDFASEAERLGAAVAEVHRDLARALPTATSTDRTERLTSIIDQLDDAATVVNELTTYRDGAIQVVDAAIDEMIEFPKVIALQRIHGDLHLGQVLRTPYTWLVIDFEGEPSKTIPERVTLDFALRDVAGMIRSFDYAAHHQLNADLDIDASAQQRFRSAEWKTRNANAFCTGYAEVSGTDPRSTPALMSALQLEKAIYEVVYEAQNRPSWVSIPLRAIAQLVGE